MGRTARDREKLLLRIKKIRGQVEGIQRALEGDEDCFAVLQTVTSCRGALTGLMSEIIEGHVRDHILAPEEEPTTSQRKAAEQLLEIVRAFLK